MRCYRYHIVADEEYIEGKIKAGSYDLALEKVRNKYRGKEIASLRVSRKDNAFIQLFNVSLWNLKTILTKILPIALAIILLYWMLNRY